MGLKAGLPHHTLAASVLENCVVWHRAGCIATPVILRLTQPSSAADLEIHRSWPREIDLRPRSSRPIAALADG